MRLQKAVSAARGSTETAVYDELLQEAATQLEAKDRELASTRLDIEARDANLDRITAENQSLKYSLSSAQSKSVSQSSVDGVSSDLAQALRAALQGSASLEQALVIVDALYGDRVVVLDTAYSSAKESDRGGFPRGSKALELLKALADDYWSDLVAGKGDQQARSKFGKNGFASKEAETISVEGRKRRTFRYNDQDILMEKASEIRSERQLCRNTSYPFRVAANRKVNCDRALREAFEFLMVRSLHCNFSLCLSRR